MTARQIFEGMLIECSKVNAPSLLLSEFNYYFNKAINLYINKRYNIYDVNLQTSDDIRVLKTTTILTPKKAYTTGDYDDTTYSPSSRLSTANSIISNLLGATYEVILPSDYLHLLNCVCVYKINKNYKCFDAGSYWQMPAKRLTSDSWSQIINDFYNRPTPERPYYFIHNVNLNHNEEEEYGNDGSRIPTNPLIMNSNGEITRQGTDMSGMYSVTTSKDNASGTSGEDSYSLSDNNGSNFPRALQLGEKSNEIISTVERATAHRYGNASQVRMEIRYGKDNSVFELVEVQVDYIKTPQHIRLTQELLDLTEDTSQIMEFPDYVCQEIINELALLIMARTGDPVLQAFPSVTLSIANPAQALAQPQAQSAS